MATPLLEAALSYAARGWRLFPLHNPTLNGGCSCGTDCSSPAKHPRTRRGFQDATSDPAVLREWWRRCPSANIGLATGEASGVWVLDLDAPELLDALAEHVPLPFTKTAVTGRGLHLYYRFAPGTRNRAALAGIQGVDVRGEGGYVVAPPSLHISGRRYDWDPEEPEEPQEASPELLALILEEHKPPAPPRPQLPASVQTVDLDGLTPYQRAALQSAGLAVRRAPSGTRNDTLNREAYSLAGLDIPVALIRAELGPAALDAGLGEKEIEKTLESGLSKGSARPRPVEEKPKKKGKKQGGSGSPGPPPSEESGASPEAFYKLTDSGNAERLVARFGDRLRYCHEWATWLVWDGTRWAPDRTAEIDRLAKETVRAIYGEAMACQVEDIRKAIGAWAHKSESADKRRALVSLARAEERIPVLPEQLDADPWLLTVKNGTLNLKTGELAPHRREDLATKLSPVEYDHDAECPLWLSFLDRVQQGNQRVISFLQRAVGYALTGDVSEHCLFFLYGTGRNGKSSFLEVIRRILGDYAQKAEMSTFLAKQSDTVRNDIAALRGARFVAATEAEGGRRLAEALVKELTGGEAIRARFLHQEFFDFDPQFKLFLGANHKPVIKGTDEGIWSRIRLVPFQVQIPAAERDKRLLQKLRWERAGILAWAVRGCLDWQANGLGEPEEITDATQAYREEMDILGDFLAARCVLTPSAKSQARELYKAYRAYCGEVEEEPISEKAFSSRLEGRGLEKKSNNKGRVWIGLGILGAPTQGDLPLSGE